MNSEKGWLKFSQEQGIARIAAGGEWTIGHLSKLHRYAAGIAVQQGAAVQIDFRLVTHMDTAGACLARQLLYGLDDSKAHDFLSNETVDSMLQIIDRYHRPPLPPKKESPFFIRKIESVGKATLDALDLVACFVVFIGSITRLMISGLFRPVHFRLGQISSQIELSGFNAIPIIVLISFLIGIVVAYQGALQLGKLGAEVYTIDLLAVTILREMGVLLSAIVIAGRSGSTFAAEIGSMKLNQELDAMYTIGMDPMEVLVIPRLVGLTISLPILTLIANISGILGGGIMVWIAMDITPILFMNQFVSALSGWTFWVGMMKAPVFAAVIAVIGCYEGLQVSGSAESLGSHTTRAVVESIFMIIVFDALFSIFFGVIGI
jgi:phospholipid/cholesterol/gamma-HCH transport system permease protein